MDPNLPNPFFCGGGGQLFVRKDEGPKGAFILEREQKRKQKRHRFQPVALFPMCVFILQRQQQ